MSTKRDQIELARRLKQARQREQENAQGAKQREAAYTISLIRKNTLALLCVALVSGCAQTTKPGLPTIIDHASATGCEIRSAETHSTGARLQCAETRTNDKTQ